MRQSWWCCWYQSSSISYNKFEAESQCQQKIWLNFFVDKRTIRKNIKEHFRGAIMLTMFAMFSSNQLPLRLLNQKLAPRWAYIACPLHDVDTHGSSRSWEAPQKIKKINLYCSGLDLVMVGSSKYSMCNDWEQNKVLCYREFTYGVV